MEVVEKNLDFKKLCRCCLKESNDLRSLFNSGTILGHVISMKDVIEEFTPVSITENDNLPQTICFKCLVEAGRAYVFYHTCIQSETTLRNYLKSMKTEMNIEVDENTGEIVLGEEIYFYNEFYEQEDNKNSDDTEQIEQDEYLATIKVDEEHSDDIQIIANKTDDTETYTVVQGNNNNEHETIAEYSENEENTENEDEIVAENEDGHVIIEIERKMNIVETTIIDNQREPKQRIKKLNQTRSKKVKGPPYKCETCGKLLSTHSSYNYHRQLHSDSTPFLCNQCGAGFKTRNAIDGHMSTHVGGHKCTICNNSYRQIGSLKTHLLTHSGEKPFRCEICGKGMTQKSGYKKHMLTHTGEKPFKCDICQKEFRYSSNMNAHKKSHSSRKLIPCDMCEKQFISNEQLQKHALTHNTKNGFSCKECGLIFKKKTLLTAHLITHSDDQRNVCKICGKTFNQPAKLKAHLKTHSDEDKSLDEDEDDESSKTIE